MIGIENRHLVKRMSIEPNLIRCLVTLKELLLNSLQINYFLTWVIYKSYSIIILLLFSVYAVSCL